MKIRIRYITLILLMLILMSFDYQPQIREPFEEYKVEQPYQQPNKAPIDWNSLDYDNPYYGWYYKQLWYLYHPNSTDTPPWIKVVPIDDVYILFIIAFIFIIVHTYILKKRNLIKHPLQ